ncbi:MAG: hypothetical protein L0387_02840 [Acidobacteria bacterium]|nr:hypothetical protein [Acidobacteriota bacterium]MCI0620601.1 hypothetical protein [Acidobacteriota bacterium]MCI0719977.1 hypothetical protein [Acidobacteriota bacterium]
MIAPTLVLEGFWSQARTDNASLTEDDASRLVPGFDHRLALELLREVVNYGDNVEVEIF